MPKRRVEKPRPELHVIEARPTTMPPSGWQRIAAKLLSAMPISFAARLAAARTDAGLSIVYPSALYAYRAVRVRYKGKVIAFWRDGQRVRDLDTLTSEDVA